MKRISVMLLAAATLAVATIGCNSAGTGGGGDPKAVLMAFSEKLGKQDYEGAAQLATKDSKSFILAMKKAMEMAKGMGGMAPENLKEQGEIDDVKMGDPKIEGDIAFIPFTVKGQPTFEYPLKKEDGSWKVDFSKETQKKLGIDTDVNFDELNKVMDEMKESGVMDTAKKFLTPENIEKMKESGKNAEKMKAEMEKMMKDLKQ